MSVKIMSAVWDRGPESRSERLVLLALADFCDDAGRCYPGMKRIAEKACMTERGAQKIIRRLESEGWLSIVTGGGRHGCNEYVIHDVNPEHRSPPNTVHPRTRKQKPRTRVQETPNGGSPEPSRTIIEPSVKRANALPCISRFPEFWDAYPHRDGRRNRKGAEAKYRAAVKRGIPEQTIIDGARSAHSDSRVRNGYARDPTTWLNQEGWADQPDTNPHPIGGNHGERPHKPSRSTAELDAWLSAARTG